MAKSPARATINGNRNFSARLGEIAAAPTSRFFSRTRPDLIARPNP
jgi:hypothetical protein